MNSDLHIKYRPKVLDEVIGQVPIVNSLENLLKEGKLPHAVLFVGNSGVGKTTLARILAKHLNCENHNTIEIDAATYTSVDDMRSLTEGLKYEGIGKNPTKFIIIDEAHMLSRAAWNSLLKAVEEPPKHVYFSFCTTLVVKVPDTIRTRCHEYVLQDVRLDDLMDLVEYVSGEEGILLPENTLDMIARGADGSPRKALVLLSQVRGCATKDDVSKVLKTVVDSGEVIDLCRLLVNRGLTWDRAVKVLHSLKDVDPELLRTQIVNYLLVCIYNTKNEKEAARFLSVLEVFSKPLQYNTSMADIVLGVGELILSKQQN